MPAVAPTLKRQQRTVAASVLAVAGLAWAYVFREAWGMDHVRHAFGACCMPHAKFWNFQEAAMVFVMWAVMMAAMMLPSAIPMVLMFVFVNRQRAAGGSAVVPAWIFVVGYLFIWTGFSAAATGLQWFLQYKAWLSPAMVSINRDLSAVLLVAAGIFEMTSLKNACLSHCRTPLDFLMTDWRDGGRGALVMGLRHGLYCAGCCGPLMALLFVLGVMNMWWIAMISAVVLLEKAAPKSWRFSYVLGAVLIGWGVCVWSVA